MAKLSSLPPEWTKEAGYPRDYDELEREFALAASIAQARGQAALAREEMAGRMRATLGAVAHLEAGRRLLPMRAFERLLHLAGALAKSGAGPVRPRRRRRG